MATKKRISKILEDKISERLLEKLNLQRKGVPFEFNKNEQYNYFKGLSGTEPAGSHSSDKTRENQTEEEFNNLENTEM